MTSAQSHQTPPIMACREEQPECRFLSKVYAPMHCAVLTICISLCLCIIPQAAFGDVRKGDVIVGRSIEQRGMAAALCPSIDANFAIVVGQDGTVYYERDTMTPTQIASLTKIMTAYVALEEAELTTEITVSQHAAEIGESSAHLQEGDKLTLEAALNALMLPSGNDAATAIAEAVGHRLLSADGVQNPTAEDAVARFVKAMNDKAAALGCTDTVFENPHGLDDGEYEGDLHSTAADMAKIVSEVMKNETFRTIVAKDSETITVLRDGVEAAVDLESTDELLGEYEGAAGVKTGFTDAAGACFAGAVNRNDTYLYSIVLDSTSEAQRFADTTTLFDWVFNNTKPYTLAHSSVTQDMYYNGQMRTVPVVANVALSAWIDKTVPATFADPDASIEVFTLRGNISQSFEFYDVAGAVKAGDVVGKATFYQDNAVVATQDLIACEDVAAPDIFETISIAWSRFIGSFSDNSEVAESVVLNETPLIYDKTAPIVA